MFTTYGHGRHVGHVIKPSCLIFSFTTPRSFHLIFWFQIIKQSLRKTTFRFENGVTFVEGQIMTLTFGIHVASLNHLVQCIYEL